MSEPIITTVPATSGGPNADNALPWIVDLDVFESSWFGVFNLTVDATSIHGARLVSDGTRNVSLSFLTVLAKGTWTIELLHDKGPNRGIFTVLIDDLPVGTIDAFHGSSQINQRSSITNVSIGLTGRKTLQIVMATRNPASSNYVGAFQHIQLRRTA